MVVDDESLARELIETHLNQLDNFELVASCASAIEASQKLKEHSIDLLFLDIEMPVLKGIDFYQSLSVKPSVIFTTAYRDYALEGFELEAVDYLLKPIVFSRFFKAIQRFLNQTSSANQTNSINQANPGNQNNQTNNKFNDVAISPEGNNSPVRNHLFVRKDRKQVKIDLDQILYVHSLKDYIQVYLEDQKHIIKYSISAFHKELGNDFMRVHRSYIVNKSKITAFTNNDIELGEIEIPIGDNYRQQVHGALKP